MTAGAAIVLDGVRKSFEGGRVQALREVSFTVDPGELVALTGSSGSGKSTILNLVGALDVPDEGTITVAGKSFEGRTVQLQRLLPGNRWVTLSRVKLNARSGGVFSALVLPRGTSLVRVAMSVNQAGAGYLGAFSRTLSYKR